jgi:hypothetical protein
MQLPARLGKYELQEFLGGGMSHVYRAFDTVIGRQVAVKILTEPASQDAEARGFPRFTVFAKKMRLSPFAALSLRPLSLPLSLLSLFRSSDSDGRWLDRWNNCGRSGSGPTPDRTAGVGLL